MRAARLTRPLRAGDRAKKALLKLFPSFDAVTAGAPTSSACLPHVGELSPVQLAREFEDGLRELWRTLTRLLHVRGRVNPAQQYGVAKLAYNGTPLTGEMFAMLVDSCCVTRAHAVAVRC